MITQVFYTRSSRGYVVPERGDIIVGTPTTGYRWDRIVVRCTWRDLEDESFRLYRDEILRTRLRDPLGPIVLEVYS